MGLFFYPNDGGVYKIGVSDQLGCLAYLHGANRKGHPAGKKFRTMTGTFSRNCIFEGQTSE